MYIFLHGIALENKLEIIIIIIIFMYRYEPFRFNEEKKNIIIVSQDC